MAQVEIGKGFTTKEHLSHILNIADVERTKVKYGKIIATAKHLGHIRDIAGVEMRESNGREIFAMKEHLCHCRYLAGVHVTPNELLKFRKTFKPARHVRWPGISKRYVEFHILDGRLVFTPLFLSGTHYALPCRFEVIVVERKSYILFIKLSIHLLGYGRYGSHKRCKDNESHR